MGVVQGKIAVRDEMVASLHKAGILVETRRRKYEASKEKKLERLAKFDQVRTHARTHAHAT
jgi:hypothetical protein